MNTELIKIRVLAFLYEFFALVATAMLGVFASEEFRTLVTQNFGETFVTSAVLLFISGAVKHLRNVQVLRKAQFGGSNQSFHLI